MSIQTKHKAPLVFQQPPFKVLSFHLAPNLAAISPISNFLHKNQPIKKNPSPFLYLPLPLHVFVSSLISLIFSKWLKWWPLDRSTAHSWARALDPFKSELSSLSLRASVLKCWHLTGRRTRESCSGRTLGLPLGEPYAPNLKLFPYRRRMCLRFVPLGTVLIELFVFVFCCLKRTRKRKIIWVDLFSKSYFMFLYIVRS